MVQVTADKKFSTSMQVFMACFGYKEDDTFKTPSEVTSVLAQWHFLLRCIALYYAAEASKKDKTTTAFEWVPSHRLVNSSLELTSLNPIFSKSTPWTLCRWVLNARMNTRRY